jgi:hypothetical protein
MDMGWTGIFMETPVGQRNVREILEKEFYPGVKIVKVGQETAWGIVDSEISPHLKNLIVCILWRSEEGEFRYKEMDETMGPFFYDVPQCLLDLPCEHASNEWRDKARRA